MDAKRWEGRRSNLHDVLRSKRITKPDRELIHEKFTYRNWAFLETLTTRARWVRLYLVSWINTQWHTRRNWPSI
jgi:hypothetical protein